MSHICKSWATFGNLLLAPPARLGPDLPLRLAVPFSYIFGALPRAAGPRFLLQVAGLELEEGGEGQVQSFEGQEDADEELDERDQVELYSRKPHQ